MHSVRPRNSHDQGTAIHRSAPPFWAGCLLALLSFPPLVTAGEFSGAAESASLSVDIRQHSFQRNFEGDTRDMEDLALGGILRLRKTLVPGLDAGLGLYVANGLGLNDDNKAVYGLLGRDEQGRHRDYAVLGEGYLRYGRDADSLSIGRVGIKTPWVNPHDVRLTPNAFEAVVLRHRVLPGGGITLAHVSRMKRKNGTRFLPMSEHAAGEGDEPVSLIGLVYSGLPRTRLQLWDYLAHQMWNDVYLRLDRKWASEAGPDYVADLRCLKRKSLGAALAGPLDTYHCGVGLGLKYGGLSGRLAWSRNGDQGITRVWGHDMTVSNQVYVADRARESAWKFAAGYRFSNQGLPSLRAALVYSVANTPDSGPAASPDRGELNLDLGYEFGESLQGLSLRARYALVNEWGTDRAEDVTDVRFYIRYRFEL
jgi:hypothetical protein